RHRGSTMKRLPVSLLAIGLAVASTTAAAQSAYGNDRYDDGYTSQQQTYYDYARVLRVDPVLDGRYRTTSNQYRGERCYETTTAGRYERDAYGNGGYRDGRDYRDGYGGYGYGRPSGYGDSASRSMATIAAGIVGAVL